jgi:hypothetical protein
MTLDVVMDTMETLQPFLLEFVNALGFWKQTKERRKGKQMRIHHLTKKTVRAYGIVHGHKIADMSHDLLVENLTEKGTSSSMISRWMSKTFQRQAKEANKLFYKLGLQKTLKDFFQRFEQHCVCQ